MTKKMVRAVCVSFLCVLLTLGVTLSAQAAEIEITIDVAPNVLNLASSGTVVTVLQTFLIALSPGPLLS